MIELARCFRTRHMGGHLPLSSVLHSHSVLNRLALRVSTLCPSEDRIPFSVAVRVGEDSPNFIRRRRNDRFCMHGGAAHESREDRARQRKAACAADAASVAPKAIGVRSHICATLYATRFVPGDGRRVFCQGGHLNEQE